MSTAPPPIRLVTVNIGLPAALGSRSRSAIAKQPVLRGSMLVLTSLNLAGDAQADRRVHGGPDKAVYAYPSEHLSAWRADLHQALDGPAPFGENLSTAGATEAEVTIGERWAWGTAVLEVVQPRWPCSKLTAHRGTADAGRIMRATGRTGWYLRVVQPGEVPVDGPIEVLERPDGPTVLDAHRAMSDAVQPGLWADEVLAERVAAVPALAAEWREPLLFQLNGPEPVDGEDAEDGAIDPS